MYFRKLRSSLIISLLFSSMIGSFVPLQINGYSQSEALQSKFGAKKSEISSQIDTIKNELNGLNSNLEQVSNKKRTLKEEVAAIQQEIDDVNRLITETKLAISQLEAQLKTKEEEIVTVREQLVGVINILQKQNQTSKLEIILTSKSLGEAISSLYNLNDVQVQAKKLSEKLALLKKELEESKKQQEEIQKTLQNSQYLLSSKQDGLKILLEQTAGEESKYQELINKTREQEVAAQANLNNVESEYQGEIEREKEEARKAAASNGSFPGSGINGGLTNKSNGGSCDYTEEGNLGVGKDYFGDPTKGYVTQDYWCGGSGAHDGWDIANGLGTPIVAVADGEVAKTGYHPRGFGNFVLLKHNLPSGKRVYTLYAHMNAPTTASGSVSKGQQIGQMGSTGFSTGPHLHFMFVSTSFERVGDVGCYYGNSLCYDPADYLD
jgi:murein DD-endopeptidase MepM/ murein hydrolase activator NlpD